MTVLALQNMCCSLKNDGHAESDNWGFLRFCLGIYPSFVRFKQAAQLGPTFSLSLIWLFESLANRIIFEFESLSKIPRCLILLELWGKLPLVIGFDVGTFDEDLHVSSRHGQAIPLQLIVWLYYKDPR